MVGRVPRAHAGRLAIGACGLGAIWLAFSPATAAAQSPAEYYRGKTVSMVIGYSVGGGYDIYARLLARYLGKHIPGAPTVVAQNMPGAGSQKSVEYLLSVAPRDGLTFGTFSRSMPMAPLLEGARFDATKLEWVGSMATDTTTCVAWHTSAVKKLDDLKSRPFTVGALGKGSDPEIYARLVKNLFGYPIRIVSGYPGTNDAALAMERGEVEGMCGYSWSTLRSSRKQWVDDKKVVVLVQGALVPHPELKGVPMMLDAAGSERKKQALTLVLAAQAMARPFAMPPGVPKDRVEAMRNAFMAAMQDPELIKEAGATNLELDPMSGSDMAALMAKVYSTPVDVVKEAAAALGE